MHEDSRYRTRHWAPGLLFLLGAALISGLSGCSSSGTGGHSASHVRDYAPPGPAGDPWGPYIQEASSRFGVPEPWIREVMRRESGGRQYMRGGLTTSSAGAMGLMQVMPGTYRELQARFGLGSDPYHPRDNILAGTAYIREMYDRFGFPAFLAAYNAGPRRLEDHLYGGRPLPGETTSYLAAVAPRLASSAAASGPLAVYAQSVPETSADELNRSALAALPSVRSAPVMQSIPAARVESYAVAEAGPPADELNRRVLAQAQPAPAASYAAPPPAPAPAPATPVRYAAAAPPVASEGRVLLANAAPPGAAESAIQVGAFTDSAQARAAADSARLQGEGLLHGAQVAVTPVTRMDGSVLYRARLVGMDPALADAACGQLTLRGIACIVLPPDRLT